MHLFCIRCYFSPAYIMMHATSTLVVHEMRARLVALGEAVLRVSSVTHRQAVYTQRVSTYLPTYLRSAATQAVSVGCSSWRSPISHSTATACMTSACARQLCKPSVASRWPKHNQLTHRHIYSALVYIQTHWRAHAQEGFPAHRLGPHRSWVRALSALKLPRRPHPAAANPPTARHLSTRTCSYTNGHAVQ